MNSEPGTQQALLPTPAHTWEPGSPACLRVSIPSVLGGRRLGPDARGKTQGIARANSITLRRKRCLVSIFSTPNRPPSLPPCAFPTSAAALEAAEPSFCAVYLRLGSPARPPFPPRYRPVAVPPDPRLPVQRGRSGGGSWSFASVTLSSRHVSSLSILRRFHL